MKCQISAGVVVMAMAAKLSRLLLKVFLKCCRERGVGDNSCSRSTNGIYNDGDSGNGRDSSSGSGRKVKSALKPRGSSTWSLS